MALRRKAFAACTSRFRLRKKSTVSPLYQLLDSDRSMETHPFAFDGDGGLVHSPKRPDRAHPSSFTAATFSPDPLTVWVNVAELPAKPVVPLYVAVIKSEPADRAFVVSPALPPTRVAVPSVVAPWVNVTVPVGVPLLEVTAAVNFTD
jgi:hypothetical protein